METLKYRDLDLTLVVNHVLNGGIGTEDEIGKDARVQRSEPTLGHDVPPRLEEARF
jgi:hypothetical protein